MITITQIVSRVAKIMNGDRRAARIEDMILKAYEAGRRDGVADVRTTLYDDMINADHIAAIEIIDANY